MKMNLKVKLYLEDGNEKFMGIGVLWLLQKIKETGSLRQAAAGMDISYSKAFNMISNLEKTLGKPVLERRRGGQDRQGSVLTPYAEQFMSLYDSFQKECKELLKDPFDRFSKELKKLD